MKKLSTGSKGFDDMLRGGYEQGILTTIYGPAGSGKSNFCIMAMASYKGPKKIIYIDTEGSFSIERLKQISPDYESVLARSLFFNPTNFEEQKALFNKLREVMDQNIGLIIFDSVAMLYRLEIGKNKDVYNVNKELGMQLSYLSEMARKKMIPVLITNQVYSDFEKKDNVKMVGGDILKYSSKCLIELKKNHYRKAILRKHRSISDGEKIYFRIVDEGIEKINEENEQS